MKHLPLLQRLWRQLIASGMSSLDAREEAVRQLRERGHMHQNSERLTKAGQRRQSMGPAGRAIDRAAKRSGRPKNDYEYVHGRVRLKKSAEGSRPGRYRSVRRTRRP